MRTAAVTFIVLALAAGSADAQGRGRGNNRANPKGVPPGHMPAAGQCRVWYDGVPPGRQPRPTNCDQAERIASRDPNARVIYGDDRYYGNNDRYDRRDRRDRNDRDDRNDPYDNGRVGGGRGSSIGDRVRDAIRNRNGQYPNAGARRGGVNNVAFDNGYRDGLEKGREDARDRDSYDPVRHSRYRSADRGYDSRYGSRDSYKLVYRNGFEAGYEAGYRGVNGYGRTTRR